MRKKFKDFLRNNRWLKWFPNFLTICNSLCGFAAIINALRVYDLVDKGGNGIEDILAQSAWMILFAMVFDALDGFAARILNAASLHGIQMDSLSDMVTFGLAPATLVTVMAQKSMPNCTPGMFKIVWLLAAVYIGCAALRLATYNVHAMLEKKSSDKFSGLPSPGAAAAICTIVIYYSHLGIQIPHLPVILPFYAALLGFLMVCNIQYQHCGKWLVSLKRNKRRLAFLLLLVGFAAWKLELTAVLFVNLYIVWGVLAALLRRFGVFKPISMETAA